MNGTAFITGASSGFGRGFALKLSADGHGVGLAARRVDRVESLVQEIRRGGGAAIACPCDVAEPSQIREAVSRTENELGPVDLLIANAGVSVRTEVHRFDADEVEWVTRVNFLGAVHAVGAVLPGMLDRGRGHLVGIGSLAGYRRLPRTAAYSASKGALYNFFESLRIDLRGTGVDVTLITPGYVKIGDDRQERALDAVPDRDGRRRGPHVPSTQSAEASAHVPSAPVHAGLDRSGASAPRLRLAGARQPR